LTIVVSNRSRWVLPLVLRERARELGDRPFVSFAVGEQEFSYREVDELSDRVAAGLAALGLSRGDNLLLMLGNRAEFVLAWFGAAKLGAVQVPVNTDYRGEFLEHVANTARAKAIVVEERLLEAVERSLPRLEHLETVVVAGAAAAAGRRQLAFDDLLADRAPPAVEVRPADTGAIHFTSGTTGRSKGASLPHAHGHLLAERNRELLDVDAESVYLTQLPLFHINAQMTVHSALLVGARARVEERFSATRWLEQVRESGATHCSILGVMLEFVQAQPPSEQDRAHCLRSMWTVPFPPDLVSAFGKRFGIERLVTSYGTTETGMLARRVFEGRRDSSAGTVSDELYEVRVVDPEDEPLPPGEVGEVVVRPRLPWIVAQGYFGDPIRSLETVRNLWYHTGDAGRFDEEGRLHFVDRLVDRIRRRGENVASADVESVLSGHPAVAECAVVAVAADEAGGEDEIKACLVLHDDADFDTDAFERWCEERLPYFAVPRYLELLRELPKTPTEKVVKQELRAAGVTESTIDRGPTGRRRRP
jgi:crotonobetaine/carnitine-CoA ligase